MKPREYLFRVLAIVFLMAAIIAATQQTEAYPPPPASGDTVVTKNRSLAGTPTQSHTGIAIADSSDHVTPLGSQVAILGNQAVYCDVEFETAAATLVVWVTTYESQDGISFQKLTTQRLTATADSTQTVGAWYAAKAPLIFLTGVANYYELRIEAPSAGRVNVRHWLGSSRPGQ